MTTSPGAARFFCRGICADVGVELGDDGHVGLGVAGEQHFGTEAADFFVVVEKAEHDGDLRASGDVVEAGFPTFCLAARALDGDGDDELVAPMKQLDGLGDHAGVLTAIDCDAAAVSHHYPVRALEEAVFAHPIDLQAESI